MHMKKLITTLGAALIVTAAIISGTPAPAQAASNPAGWSQCTNSGTIAVWGCAWPNANFSGSSSWKGYIGTAVFSGEVYINFTAPMNNTISSLYNNSIYTHYYYTESNQKGEVYPAAKQAGVASLSAQYNDTFSSIKYYLTTV